MGASGPMGQLKKTVVKDKECSSDDRGNPISSSSSSSFTTGGGGGERGSGGGGGGFLAEIAVSTFIV